MKDELQRVGWIVQHHSQQKAPFDAKVNEFVPHTQDVNLTKGPQADLGWAVESNMGSGAGAQRLGFSRVLKKMKG